MMEGIGYLKQRWWCGEVWARIRVRIDEIGGKAHTPTQSVPSMVHSSGSVILMNPAFMILPPFPNRSTIYSSSFIEKPVLQATFKSSRVRNPLRPRSIEAKISSIRVRVEGGSSTPCFFYFFRLKSVRSKLSASWMLRYSKHHYLITSRSAAVIPSQQTFKKSSRVTSPRLRRSKCLNKELTCFFRKAFFSKPATNSLGRIYPRLPDRDLKQLMVEKMSYLLVILPFRNSTRLDRCGEYEAGCDEGPIGESQGEGVDVSLGLEVSCCLDCMGGSTLDSEPDLVSTSELERMSVKGVCLSLCSFSSRRCLMHCIFLFSSRNRLFFSSSSTSSKLPSKLTFLTMRQILSRSQFSYFLYCPTRKRQLS